MSDIIHHQHKRKRVHLHKQEYPHPHKFKRFMDHAIYVLGVVGPVMGSLQAYKIFAEQTAAGIALPTYAFNVFANIFWLIYGVIHKEKPIVLMYALWFIVNVLIVTGTIIYS